MCLQSCSHSTNLPCASVKEESVVQTQETMHQAGISSILNKEFSAQAGHILTFYKEAGQLQAVVKENCPIGFSKTHILPVYIEQGAELSDLLRLGEQAQQRRIHIQLAQGHQPAKVVIYKGAGLMGGGKKKKQLTDEQKAIQKEKRARKEEEKAKMCKEERSRKREEEVKLKKEKARLRKEERARKRKEENVRREAEKVALKNTPLHEAILEGNATKLYELVHSGADIYAKGRYGTTPLQLAVRKSDVELISLLLDQRADINKDKISKLLYLAIRRSDVEVVNLLLEYGADINSREHNGISPLHVAVDENRTEVVKLLLEQGVDLNVRNNYQNTPLHWAIRKGYIGVAKLLVQYGADINAQGEYGASPLHIAVAESQMELVKLFLEQGADIYVKGKYNDLVLHWAAARGNVHITKLLLEHEAYICAKLNWDIFQRSVESVHSLVEREFAINSKDDSGDTPLHKAARNGHLEVVEILLDQGANANATNIKGLTPYQVTKEVSILTVLGALSITDVNVLDKRVEKENVSNELKEAHKGGVDVTSASANSLAKDKYDDTDIIRKNKSLQKAIVRGDVKRVSKLINIGLDINAKNIDGNTLLYLAAQNSWIEVAKLLIENGAKVNEVSKNGEIPLHSVAEKGQLELVDLLAEQKSNFNAKNITGNTPLHLAVINNHVEVVRLLLQLGAKWNVENKSGRTPLQFAIRKGYTAIADLIISKEKGYMSEEEDTYNEL
ncbi:ankyrin repeat domain-containing protein [Candidatus Amoebophilus asiaticus]|uniref:ankyrin repeat domain-containing protein n=1 Tax=Candidatus Amoebophilus asiaticus TaxID=281120 RepID=UPI00031491E2|nr:ankyrin repeat domain-containing protein [Candidatus Amoebophilus asiaticus]